MNYEDRWRGGVARQQEWRGRACELFSGPPLRGWVESTGGRLSNLVEAAASAATKKCRHWFPVRIPCPRVGVNRLGMFNRGCSSWRTLTLARSHPTCTPPGGASVLRVPFRLRNVTCISPGSWVPQALGGCAVPRTPPSATGQRACILTQHFLICKMTIMASYTVIHFSSFSQKFEKLSR